MNSLQVLRTTFPDMNFYGNTFVALDLAQGMTKLEGYHGISANAPPKVTLRDPKLDENKAKLWSQVMREYRGFNVNFATYSRERFKHEGAETCLSELIEVILKKTGKGVILDYHYPEKDLMAADAYEQYPAMFGTNVRQFVHLHCMADLLLRYAERRQDNVIIPKMVQLAEAGKVRKYIAVSSEVRDSFVSQGVPDRMIEVVPNGINPDIYQFRHEPDREAFRKQAPINGKFLIGYSGRLDIVKGYDNLMMIIEWFDRRPEFDVGFVIAATNGRFKDRVHEELGEKARRLMKENRVAFVVDVAKFVGNRKSTNSFVDNYMTEYIAQNLATNPLYRNNHELGGYRVTTVPVQALVDLYIQPSNSEGFGLAALEALAVGTPVVANRVGGLREIVPDLILGQLVDYHARARKRNAEFCDAMISTLDETYGKSGEVDSTRFRHQARDKVLKKYNSNKMTEMTRAVYEFKV